MQVYGLFFLVAVAIGGVVWVFVYPFLSGEKKTERRMASVSRTEPAARPTRGAQKTRREQVEGSLKELEERQKKAKRVPLSIKLTQAGLNWSKRQFMLTSGALGVVAFLFAFLMGGPFGGARLCFCRRLRISAVASFFPEKTSRGEISQLFPRRRRRDRPRHQGRPAAP
jgi:tight adherence protein B